MFIATWFAWCLAPNETSEKTSSDLSVKIAVANDSDKDRGMVIIYQQVRGDSNIKEASRATGQITVDTRSSLV